MISLAAPPKDAFTSILDEPVSASRLNTFHQCRRKFTFTYLEKIKKPATAPLHVGRMVHAGLQEWNTRRWLNRPCTAEDIRPSFDENWRLSQLDEPVIFDEGEEEVQKQKAWGLVEHYLANTPLALDEKPEAVEVMAEADLSKHGLPKIRGVIDLIQDSTIVDFKTSAVTPSSDPDLVFQKHENQLTLYSLLYRDAVGKKEKGQQLHHIVKLKSPKLVVTSHEPATEKQVTRLFRAIESYMDGVERGDDVPSVGLHCSSCSYQRECLAWTGERL
ncbi:MAG: PD-(D/E)XK nuclease family protein [Chthoniobacterales bacterium]|nr:PD-(D/E)XK nuclease family protein [Chthoniobacterales bacterium]